MIIEIVNKNFNKALPIPFYFEKNKIYYILGKNMLNDVDALSKYFKNVPSTFNVKLYNNIRYLI